MLGIKDRADVPERVPGERRDLRFRTSRERPTRPVRRHRRRRPIDSASAGSRLHHAPAGRAERKLTSCPRRRRRITICASEQVYKRPFSLVPAGPFVERVGLPIIPGTLLRLVQSREPVQVPRSPAKIASQLRLSRGGYMVWHHAPVAHPAGPQRRLCQPPPSVLTVTLDPEVHSTSLAPSAMWLPRTAQTRPVQAGTIRFRMSGILRVVEITKAKNTDIITGSADRRASCRERV